MRILHIDTGKEIRGGQIQLALTVKGLREAGHDCAVLTGHELGLAVVWSRSKAFDLVHAHDAHAHTMAALVSRRPFVVSRRVAFPVKRTPTSRWKYARARRFIAVSQFVARELEAAGVPNDKIDIVYDGVEIERAAAGWNAANPAVALGSADPQKGRRLVEQAGHIAGIPIVFSINLTRDLLNASMFVYVTQSEGLGSAALLAMAMGVPVIASRVGGLNEVFEDEVSGLFVANRTEEVAAAMRMVRENPTLAATLISEGKRRVQEKFSKERLIEGTLKSYESALAG